MTNSLKDNPVVAIEFNTKELPASFPMALYDVKIEFADGVIWDFRNCSELYLKNKGGQFYNFKDGAPQPSFESEFTDPMKITVKE